MKKFRDIILNFVICFTASFVLSSIILALEMKATKYGGSSLLVILSGNRHPNFYPFIFKGVLPVSIISTLLRIPLIIFNKGRGLQWLIISIIIATTIGFIAGGLRVHAP